MPIDLVRQLMDEFAENTGLAGSVLPRRYLWTDAYAVCNYFALHHRTAGDRYLNLARELIRQVHQVLGRHRPDDSRDGWISGLSEEKGKAHPTRGGLRIGKALNERSADEPYDPQDEWDRDGQYFHYLTRWMHALYRAFQETDNRQYRDWAVDLALVAHQAFTVDRSAGRSRRMVWKMSIDLTRPLVESMGHHDPLDGLVTALELSEDAELKDAERRELNEAIADYRLMSALSDGATTDALGIGGLLDCMIRVMMTHPLEKPDSLALLHKLFRDTAVSLREYSRTMQLSLPAEHRLAFRELGLSIGLRGLESLSSADSEFETLSDPLQTILQYRYLADQIESFWVEPQHRRSGSWRDHADINSVMLATTLHVDGYFGAGRNPPP